MKKRTFISISLVICMTFAITACGKISNKESGLKHTISVDYPISYDIDEVINASDYIVSGHFSKFSSSWNMARNPENIKKEATNMNIEGKLYEFVIKKEFKGDLNKKDTILVNLSYKHNGIVDELFIEPTLNEEVSLFLKYDKDFDCYYPALEPFQFSIVNEQLKVKSNNKNVKTNFEKKEKKIKLDDLGALINKKN